MSWLLILGLVASSATFSFILGWTLCRSVSRREAQAARIRASLQRITDGPATYAAWRYRR